MTGETASWSTLTVHAGMVDVDRVLRLLSCDHVEVYLVSLAVRLFGYSVATSEVVVVDEFYGDDDDDAEPTVIEIAPVTPGERLYPLVVGCQKNELTVVVMRPTTLAERQVLDLPAITVTHTSPPESTIR